ncbi:MAG: histidine kinase dimerization/phospho-acceptor domain-containing protein [Hymenobacter sp.]
MVIVAAVVVTVLVRVGSATGCRARRRERVLAAGALGPRLVQVLARGMTSPLREMAAAATAMARGDYGRRVTATSRDEVGRAGPRVQRAWRPQLGEVDRVRRDLVANVSHELRTPISALQAVLENLVDGVEPAGPGDAARRCCARPSGSGALVAQLLDLSRLESGARAAPVDGRSSCSPLLEDAAGRDPAAQRRRRRDGDGRRPAGRHGSTATRSAMHQVVANLLDNAVRHSPAGGHGASCAATRSAGRRHHRGRATRAPGISRRREDQRCSSASTGPTRPDRPRHGGAGLGLAIARWIVDLTAGTSAPRLAGARRAAGWSSSCRRPGP